MKKSVFISTAIAAAMLISPAASAQSSWSKFTGQTQRGQALNIDPARGVLTMAPLLERTTPAVVNISVSTKVKARQNPLSGNEDFFERFFGENNPRRQNRENDNGERTQRSVGSGVIINAGKGYILTNHHVVDGADKITITLKDKRTATAELVGSDEGTDIALLKIDLKNLTDVPLANSDTVKVGDYVIAIGNAFGIGQTVTSGIVSALGRSTFSQGKYQDYIQTDAAINQGNSGGALINSKGELIGINAAILSRSGGSNGIGFAVPTNMVTGIMDQLVAYGEVHRGRIGVGIQNISTELMEAMHLPNRDGALVSQVTEGSPAAKAGLEVGDVITGFNGEDILDADDIRIAVGFVEPGQRARISYLRDGKKYSTRIGVEKTPEKTDVLEGDVDASSTAQDDFEAFGGASFGSIPSDLNPSGGRAGVVITNIKRGSDAWEAGLRKDDIIRAVNNTKVKNLEAFEAAVSKKKGAIFLTVQRGRSQVFIAVK